MTPQSLGSMSQRGWAPDFDRGGERTPLAVLGLSHESRAECVALHVSQDRQQMLVRLHRDGVEPPLAQMPAAGSPVVCVPAHGVGDRQPANITPLS